MKEAGIPVVPGTDSPVYEVEEALEAAEVIGFPRHDQSLCGRRRKRHAPCLEQPGVPGALPRGKSRRR